MNFTYKERAEDRRNGSIEAGAMNALVFCYCSLWNAEMRQEPGKPYRNEHGYTSQHGASIARSITKLLV